MFKRILTYGVIAGLLVGVPLFVITVYGKLSHGGYVLGYTIMLIALSTVFVAIKRQRDVDGGGVIKFWPALGLGLGISIIAGVFYVAAWEAAVAFTHMDFATDYANAMIKHAKAHGMNGAKLAQLIAQMNAWRAQYANPLYRLPMTFNEIFPVGVLVSLVSAGLLSFTRFLPARR